MLRVRQAGALFTILVCGQLPQAVAAESAQEQWVVDAWFWDGRPVIAPTTVIERGETAIVYLADDESRHVEIRARAAPHRHPNQVSLEIGYAADGFDGGEAFTCSTELRKRNRRKYCFGWYKGLFFRVRIERRPANSELQTASTPKGDRR